MTRQKGKINRGIVHVISNKQDTVYEATDDPMKIRVYLRQVEVWPFNGCMVHKEEKSAYLDGDIDYMLECGFTAGMVMPGNIIQIQQFEPLDDKDPEHGLLWDKDKVVRVNGKCVYHFSYYNAESLYTDVGTADMLLIDESNDHW